MKEQLIALGEKCRIKRILSNKKLHEVAAEAKVSEVLLAQFEKGELKSITLTKLNQIVEANELSLELSAKEK